MLVYTIVCRYAPNDTAPGLFLGAALGIVCLYPFASEGGNLIADAGNHEAAKRKHCL